MAAKAKKKTQTPPKKQPERPQNQNRRELTAIGLLIAALFGVLCWFNFDAVILSSIIKILTGLFGQVGRYILPVALAAVAILLLRSRSGKKCALRITCMLLLVVTISGLYHLICLIFADENVLTLSALYRGGQEGSGGGVLPGLLAGSLARGISIIGAVIAFLLLFLFETMEAMGIHVNSLITAIKNRPRPEPEEDEPEEEEDPAERLVNHVVTRRMERQAERKKRQPKDFDLPVDEPPLPTAQEQQPEREEEKTCRSGKARVPSPDAFLEQKNAEAEAPLPDPVVNQVTIDEIELQPIEDEPQTPAVPVETPVGQPREAAVRQPETQCREAVRPTAAPVIIPHEPEKQRPQMKKAETEATAQMISEEIAQKDASEPVDYVYPPIGLLGLRAQNLVDATGEMRENTKRLADTLKSFGIEPHIVDVIRGPSVTRYELELDKGVKLSKVTNLSDDIALALGAMGVRISAIPDKISVVGIEVPNKVVNTVFAREVIDSAAFRNSKSKISFAVGKDIAGNCIVCDIGKLPHMLIAGTTGSGKSVCMNTLIVSLLYKARPDEVRLIMVDPKMVELGVYNGIPHLLIPVVTDPKKAAGALQWAVTEMMRRYRLMADQGVRDLDSYNKTVRSDPDKKPMEQIVVVIDELADLMLVAAKEVEESICRIAQMGRASGIHLVIATQRPSADVITGLMKANIPSRIAFAVSSAMESRIILDTQGAEKLVGKGDMLFAPLGQGKPKRVQGCFISDEEVQNVVAAVKQQGESAYSQEVMEQIEKRAEQGGKNAPADNGAGASASSDGDELLPAAVEVILETGQASVSMLQRRLKLGYARAARIVDEMEERGIVGPFEGAKPRQLLITKEQWEQMQNGTYDPNPPVEEEIP